MSLSPEEYCDHCWSLVESYIDGVTNEEIVVGKFIKLQVKKFKEDLKSEKWDFKTEKVDKVFKFFSFLNINHKDKYVQFPLLGYQCFFICVVFGFYSKNEDKRKIREALLFVGRKNGKTQFSAAIVLYGMLGDGVSVPQSMLLSNTALQASNALNFCKDAIIHSPQLRKRLEGQRNKIIFSDRTKQGFAEIMSTVEPSRLEGFSPSFCILDEIHGFTNANIFASVKTGIGARQSPLLLLISTAGNKNASFCNDYLNYHKNVLLEKIEDETVFSLIYQLDADDDIANPECWVKANPALGIINSLEDLKSSFNSAQYSYVDKFNFITKHLNIFWDTPDIWIPEEKIKPLFKRLDKEKFKGKECFLGMDLSKNIDLSSFVITFPPSEEDPHYYSFPYFFMADRPDNMIRKNGLDLTYWINQGFITKFKSPVIDLDAIYEKIIEISQYFNISSVYYDRYNAPQLTSKLIEYGLTCQPFEQRAMSFNAPLKLLEELIYKQEINFDLSPPLLWNFSNIILYVDQNANIKIVKTKQNDSVDGCVALAMSLGAIINSRYGIELAGLQSYINTSKEIRK